MNTHTYYTALGHFRRKSVKESITKIQEVFL